jgi:hypothetical protein
MGSVQYKSDGLLLTICACLEAREANSVNVYVINHEAFYWIFNGYFISLI